MDEWVGTKRMESNGLKEKKISSFGSRNYDCLGLALLGQRLPPFSFP